MRNPRSLRVIYPDPALRAAGVSALLATDNGKAPILGGQGLALIRAGQLQFLHEQTCWPSSGHAPGARSCRDCQNHHASRQRGS
ncbi:hypothetical protein SBA2_790006 [Acidobacteriia bacterium SbA2]|nr:hypothetical protein SBA2_790006 [Acidobacteriia bacterium SbA2]